MLLLPARRELSSIRWRKFFSSGFCTFMVNDRLIGGNFQLLFPATKGSIGNMATPRTSTRLTRVGHEIDLELLSLTNMEHWRIHFWIFSDHFGDRKSSEIICSISDRSTNCPRVKELKVFTFCLPLLIQFGSFVSFFEL
jgi:hypothetical protein